MNKMALACMIFLLLVKSMAASAGTDDTALTPELRDKIRAEFRLDPYTRAMRNVLTSTSAKSIAENREILARHEHTFSHQIKTKGISNQKSSGRCWLFAGFNMIKPVLLQKLDLDEFEFSQIYLTFWDKMEKANTFLEYMIEFRDRDPMDRELVFLLKDPCPDGGYWENFADLVSKYGVIPKEVMAETASSEATGLMNRLLARALRKNAVELRGIFRETGSVRQMRQAKVRMLAEVYRMLVLNLGEPPTEFAWRYKIKDKKSDSAKPTDAKEENPDAENKKSPTSGQEQKKPGDDYQVEQKWSERRLYTPMSFYRECVGLDLRQFVNLTDDPIRPKDRHFEILLTKNLLDGQNMHYANVDIQTLRETVLKVLMANQAVYFAADVSPDQDSEKGLMARNLYDYESVYGLELDLNKTERMLFRDSTINHGMAFIGVDLHDGKPLKWLVENSWGSDRGNKGLWTMYDDWFEDNVFNIIVPQDYVPETVRKILETPPEKLPVWDPMW